MRSLLRPGAPNERGRSPIEAMAALLRGEEVSWQAWGLTPTQFFETCAEQDLTGLVSERLRNQPDGNWPQDIREGLTRQARVEAAKELLRRRAIIAVIDALATQSIRPVLLKGTPLAYSVYDAPYLRPRSDTDLLIPRSQVDAARQELIRLGCASTTYCGGEHLFRQFELRKTDDFGVEHAFDFHWKISTQSLFADVLTYEELAADARHVPALGPHARAAGPLHALLLACIHPVMHHRNEERLIWLYDIHLLSSGLSAAEFDRFIDIAIAKRVAAICAHELALARAHFQTRIPDAVTTRLAASGNHEPSAAYLQPDRRWQDELMSNVREIERWSDRVRLLREVLFPAPDYMLKTYGFTPGWQSSVLLPALYLHRSVRGGIKVLAGRK